MSDTLSLSVPTELVEAIAGRVADLLAERTSTAAGPESWVGVDAAAEHLACRPQRIYDLVSAGVLPHRKDGRRLLFRCSELDRYLDGQA